MSAQALWIWLATRQEVRAHVQTALLAQFGRIEQIYAADRQAFAQCSGLTKLQIESLCDKDMRPAEQIMERCATLGISVLTITDAGYPDRLRQIADPPTVLYIRGTLPDMDTQLGIAMVGTRQSTLYGEKTAQSMAYELAQAGFVVVTGMALGVDGAANRGALRANGKTVAVLGCGVDVCYPLAHRALMGDMILSGAVISEYPPATRPLAQHFPVRNRIISGLCVGTLVIEAPARSGALITAHIALDQGRDVFVIPGAVDMASCKGSNELIARGEAQLVTTSQEIIREYSGLLPQGQSEHAYPARAPSVANRPPAIAARPLVVDTKQASSHSALQNARAVRLQADNLSEMQQHIVQAIGAGATSVDEIVERTQLQAQRVTAEVTMLELDGIVTRDAGRLVLRVGLA